MNTNLPFPLKDQKEKANFLLEVTNTEKNLWLLIHSKGLLNSDVRDLYQKICSSYEKVILNDHELTELQDVEYSLWKLHYTHIDEFRKKIKRSSANAENTAAATPQNGANDDHIEGFKLFLLEATEFYKNLIVKIRNHYGLPKEFSFFKRGGISTSVKRKKLQKCHFLCHRFLVCLGDLARYREQYEKTSVENPNWSIAATYYLEAAMIWPDSGNPQNQLAVLATYVGDEFLALYHCVRSLAVKEPFPDARNNLSLLFERNRSCNLLSLPSEAHFDFLKPYEISSSLVYSLSSHDSSIYQVLKSEHDHCAGKNFWLLIIRTLSFFFIKSSMEEFPCSFASTIRELDMMMAADDTKLRAMLEAYQLMDSARTGPFRALQAVSIFIFIFHDLTNSKETKGMNDKKNMQHLELIRLAFVITFIFMGRLVERCLTAKLVDSCPLLPSVLVFVEWLVTKLDEAEAYGMDDKTKSAMGYFFAVFVDLLKQLNAQGEILPPKRTALWEDYELRGFAPLAQVHFSLDFSSNCEHIENFESGKECRAHRIVDAAMKIANRSNGSLKWISFDTYKRQFYVAEETVIPDRKEAEKIESTGCDVQVKGPGLDENSHEAMKDFEVHTHRENANNHSVNGKSIAAEEEEVILFRPLTRYNSAPLYTSINGKDPVSPKEEEDQTVPSDECLRRATSLLIAQNQAHGYPLDFQSDMSNFRRSNPFKQQEPLVKDPSQSFSEAPISAGPPSLSAWVLDRGSLSSGREKGRSDMSKGLSPVLELASSSLDGLSISKTEESVTSLMSEASTNCYSSPLYSAPVPSAPLLPDDAAWFNSAQPSFSDLKSSGFINKPKNLYNARGVSGNPNQPGNGQLDYAPAIPGLTDKFPPFCGLSSSEWLRQYRESRNMERANSHPWQVNYYSPGNPRNFPVYDGSRFGLFDRYGIPSVSNTMVYQESPPLHPGFPLAYGVDEQKREKLFHGYQRPSPYGCGVVTEVRDDPRPLLQYLKEKEWSLQQDPTLRNPTFMGN